MITMKYILILLTLLVCTSALADQPLIIGILEEPSCKQDSPRSIRPLFVKKGDEWVALDKKSKAAPYKMDRLTWTLAFDGKNLGQIVSADPKADIKPEWTYSRDYLHAVTAGQTLPNIKNKSGRFSGWCGQAPTYFPVVTVSMPYFSDPEKWKRSEPYIGDRQALFFAFEKSFKKLCMIKSKATTPYQSGPYRLNDLHVHNSYKSVQGQSLVSLNIGEGYYECDEVDSPDHGDDTHRWFYVGESIRYLGYGLTLVDAGDYDNDGKSEALFWYNAYNRNGYVLLYDGFRKRSEFIWSYH